MRLVSVPLDHGITTFRTVSDLLISVWMDSMEFQTHNGVHTPTFLLRARTFASTLPGEKSFSLVLFGPSKHVAARLRRLPPCHWIEGKDRQIYKDELYAWYGSLLVVKLDNVGEATDIDVTDGRAIESFVHRCVWGIKNKSRLTACTVMFPTCWRSEKSHGCETYITHTF